MNYDIIVIFSGVLTKYKSTYIIKYNYKSYYCKLVTVLLVYCKMIDAEQFHIVMVRGSARISIQRSNIKVTAVNTKRFEMSKTSR